MPDLCERFREHAGKVWNRMDKAAKLGMPLNEETITEITSLEMAHALQASPGFEVKIATRPEEALHGADWDWWFVRGGAGVGFRVQAKRLFPSGRYESMLRHGTAQAQKLIREANLAGRVPLYCFYNSPIPADFFSLPSSECLHPYRTRSRWGCALMDANRVLGAPTDKFSDLRLATRPWHELVCLRPGETLPGAAARFANSLRGRTERGEGEDKLSTVEPVWIPGEVAQLIDTKVASMEYGLFAATEQQGLVAGKADLVPEGLAGVLVFNDVRDEEFLEAE